MASADFDADRIWLNGREESINNPRLQNCLREIKKRAQLSPEMENWKLHICSKNNFPTAAGLASSAAGYACLSAALAKLYRVEGDISSIARCGSGSACRSVYGGFVRWYAGTDPNGNDSIAKQIVPASHWPEMRILILVVNEERKKTSSAIGMKNGVLTSELLKYRAEHCVPKRVEEMNQAIMTKNFEKFAQLMMKDSNQMHAVCLDTSPPCFYLNDVSFGVIDLIHAYNEASNRVKVGYTNDAGPNTVLYLLEKDVPEVLGLLDYYFPSKPVDNVEYKRGNPPASAPLSEELILKINKEQNSPGQIKSIIHTHVGNGPTYLKDPREHLLDSKGLPVEL
ncbi:diphosphomevalonate decarboxylase isoform X2 [Fopius arisanus]|nr:PREDICTED: diphosphomevalonate decarboxylase isoform X2 [Fopius arisanus]